MHWWSKMASDYQMTEMLIDWYTAWMMTLLLLFLGAITRENSKPSEFYAPSQLKTENELMPRWNEMLCRLSLGRFWYPLARQWRIQDWKGGGGGGGWGAFCEVSVQPWQRVHLYIQKIKGADRWVAVTMFCISCTLSLVLMHLKSKMAATWYRGIVLSNTICD